MLAGVGGVIWLMGFCPTGLEQLLSHSPRGFVEALADSRLTLSALEFCL